MFLSTILLICGTGLTAAIPTKRPDITALLQAEDESENAIDVEELPAKKTVEPPVSLGNQLAVGALFPERAGLETGHRRRPPPPPGLRRSMSTPLPSGDYALPPASL